MVRRTTVNFVVDAIAFLDLLCLIATGTILKFVLPPGSGGGHGQGLRGGRGADAAKTLLGLGRHDWGDVHFVLSMLFVLMMLIHLILHWDWVKTCVRSFLAPAGEGGASQPCSDREAD